MSAFLGGLICIGMLLFGIKGLISSGASTSSGSFDNSSGYAIGDLVYLSDGRVGHIVSVQDGLYAVELEVSPDPYFENPGDVIFRNERDLTKI